MATIARMHVELIARGDRYRRDIEKSRTTTQKLRSELTKTRSVVGLMAGAAGFSLAAKKVFELGSAAEETASKFSTVFGQSTDEVQRFIDNFATIAGLSQTQAREVTATTGSIVQGMGFAQEASARFSQEVVKLAGDLSSFNNIPIEETSLAIQAALTGEREQMKRLGIVLREADVQQRALAMSGKESAAALTQQEKATATLALITERAGFAVGDLSRTQDSAANRARALQATLRTMAEEISLALIPVFSAVIEGVLKFIKGIQIMAAETAVVIARMKFWKEAMFGTMESTMAANDELRRMRVAAEEVKNQIIGLEIGFDGLTGSIGGVDGGGEGGGGVIGALRGLNVTAATYASQLPTITTGVTVFASAQHALAAGANAAASAQERLNSALGKAQGFLGGLGGILGGLGFALPFVGSLSGILGGASTLSSVFGGGKAHGGPVSAGTAYPVGERGPELFVPRQNGTIVPNGGLTFNVGPARDPLSAARDQQWQRAIAETFRNLEGNGFRAATA